jgi:branched-chain amino acid aminotransferase
MSEWAEWVWLNGRMVRGAEATVSVFDRAFLLGDGLFETMRAMGGRIFRLDRHLARLQRGAGRLRLPLPAAAPELARAIQETLQANGLEEAAVRLTVSRGPGPPGPGIQEAGPAVVVIAARSFTGYPGRWYEPGATAIISTVVKNERSPLCAVKSISYAEHVLARTEAAERGADEALLVNTLGNLVEGSSTNMFAVVHGCLHTPDLASGCLPGITREAVLEIARKAGLTVREAPLAPATVAGWDEAFLTNSLLDVAPLVQVDGLPVGGGRPGPVTSLLAERYRDLMTGETD